eukprot:4878727-Amphidinium_carterae.1
MSLRLGKCSHVPVLTWGLCFPKFKHLISKLGKCPNGGVAVQESFVVSMKAGLLNSGYIIRRIGVQEGAFSLCACKDVFQSSWNARCAPPPEKKIKVPGRMDVFMGPPDMTTAISSAMEKTSIASMQRPAIADPNFNVILETLNIGAPETTETVNPWPLIIEICKCKSDGDCQKSMAE